MVTLRQNALIKYTYDSFNAGVDTLPLAKVSSALVPRSMARGRSGLARHERYARR